MLNLFKLPFRVGNSSNDKCNSSADFTMGVLGNYLSRKNGLSQDELDRACYSTSNELENLQKNLRAPGANLYETMLSSLRKMDKELGQRY